MDFSHLATLSNKKTKLTTSWQVRGVEIAQALGSKQYSLYIGLVKRYPLIVEQAFQWVSDYPNARNKGRLLLWKIKNLRLQNQKS